MSQHYRFAYIDLKRRALERTEEMREALWSEPESYLSWIWHGCPQGPVGLVPGLKARTFSHHGIPAVLITLPEPEEPPQAYFMLILFADEPNIYTLEMADKDFVEEGTMLGRLCSDRHENLGPGCAPQADRFLEMVLSEGENGETR